MTGLIKSAMTAAVALVLMFSGVGCCSDSDTIRFAINTKLDPSVKDADTQQWQPVTIELVGVTPTDYESWNTCDMDKYWRSDNPLNMHHDPLMLSAFTPQDGNTWTLDPKDPDHPEYAKMWDTWKEKGVMYIFVMSSYPRIGDNRPGAADSRRKIIPIQCKRWDPTPDSVTITVKSDGVTFNPSPKAEQH